MDLEDGLIIAIPTGLMGMAGLRVPDAAFILILMGAALGLCVTSFRYLANYETPERLEA